MEVAYKTTVSDFTNVEEVVIPTTDISPARLRQIEYLCTSNEGIVTKNESKWVIQEL